MYISMLGGYQARELGHDDDDEEPDPAEPWDTEWDLPDQLRPIGNLVPNRNLLEWFPAQRMTPETDAFFGPFVDVDLRAHTFEVHGIRSPSGIPIFYDVLKTVSILLSTAKVNQPLNTYKSDETFSGSVANVPYQVRVTTDIVNNMAGMNITPLPRIV